jgi:hypothetical protein
MGLNAFENLSDVLKDTALRNHLAAQARNAPEPVGAESPRDVYLQSCAQIAATFSDQGYKFAKSGPHLTKNTKLFRYMIAFQSSHNNIPGQHVALWMAANVRSPSLKKWRSQQTRPYRTDDWLAGGMVHLLCGKHSWVEWELADPQARKNTVNDAIRFIREVVLPYFQQFDDPDGVTRLLLDKPIPECDLASSVEFLLHCGKQAEGQQVMDRFVAVRPDLQAEMIRLTEQFRREGLPNRRSHGYAEQVAWLRVAYDLR